MKIEIFIFKNEKSGIVCDGNRQKIIPTYCPNTLEHSMTKNRGTSRSTSSPIGPPLDFLSAGDSYFCSRFGKVSWYDHTALTSLTRAVITQGCQTYSTTTQASKHHDPKRLNHITALLLHIVREAMHAPFSWLRLLKLGATPHRKQT